MKRAKHAQNSKLTIQNSKLMKIQPADRLSLVQEYYFSRKLKEVAKLNAEGKDIISLAIGSPDMPHRSRQ